MAVITGNLCVDCGVDVPGRRKYCPDCRLKFRAALAKTSYQAGCEVRNHLPAEPPPMEVHRITREEELALLAGTFSLGQPIELRLPGLQKFVYRFWNAAGDCLYVGKTTAPDPIIRAYKHSYTTSWWPEVARADYVNVEGDLNAAETCQIAELRPKYNIAKNPTDQVAPSRNWNRVVRQLVPDPDNCERE